MQQNLICVYVCVYSGAEEVRPKLLEACAGQKNVEALRKRSDKRLGLGRFLAESETAVAVQQKKGESRWLDYGWMIEEFGLHKGLRVLQTGWKDYNWDMLGGRFGSVRFVVFLCSAISS
ncbi:hypothetical protein F0562_003363 [Nyssa sinensis]|uniref:Uncharacterized protein n=1 Tax=Nyssa sinensis TaxID=561372 RepID=A0A5J5BWB2_9ASTE|nr:hypothetical protein F0562_003363 [Nyssa sinensis]